MIAALLLAVSLGVTETNAGNESQFREDVRSFYADLTRARPQAPDELRRLVAYHATAEAYRWKVPPALVFGVLMQETSNLDPKATSIAGARGLMQIMPFWRRSLGVYFGLDLTDPVSNVRYGVWILAHYLHMERGDVPRAVHRYSGGATRYHEKIEGHIRNKADALCSHNYSVCVASPVRAVFGRR